MKKAIALYKQFYEVPDDVSDLSVISHMIVYAILFFTLGFAVSQVIVFLVN